MKHPHIDRLLKSDSSTNEPPSVSTLRVQQTCDLEVTTSQYTQQPRTRSQPGADVWPLVDEVSSQLGRLFLLVDAGHYLLPLTTLRTRDECICSGEPAGSFLWVPGDKQWHR